MKQKIPNIMFNCKYTTKNFSYKKETFYNFGFTKKTAVSKANQNQNCLQRLFPSPGPLARTNEARVSALHKQTMTAAKQIDNGCAVNPPWVGGASLGSREIRENPASLSQGNQARDTKPLTRSKSQFLTLSQMKKKGSLRDALDRLSQKVQEFDTKGKDEYAFQSSPVLPPLFYQEKKRDGDQIYVAQTNASASFALPGCERRASLSSPPLGGEERDSLGSLERTQALLSKRESSLAASASREEKKEFAEGDLSRSNSHAYGEGLTKQTNAWLSIKKKKLGSSYSKLSEVKLITIGLASPLRILQWAEKTLPNGKIYGEVLNANTLHHKTFKPMKGGLFCERIFGPLKDFECACGKIDNTVKKDLKHPTALSLLDEKWEGSAPATQEALGNNIQFREISSAPLTSTGDKKGASERCPALAAGELSHNTRERLATPLLSLVPRKFCPECDVEYTWSVIRRYQLGYIKLISPVTHIWFLKGNPSYLSLLLDMKKRYLQYVTYGSETLTLENSLFPIKNFPTFFPSPSSVKDSGLTLDRSTTYSTSLQVPSCLETTSNLSDKSKNSLARNITQKRLQLYSFSKSMPSRIGYGVAESAVSALSESVDKPSVRDARGTQVGTCTQSALQNNSEGWGPHIKASLAFTKIFPSLVTDLSGHLVQNLQRGDKAPPLTEMTVLSSVESQHKAILRSRISHYSIIHTWQHVVKNIPFYTLLSYSKTFPSYLKEITDTNRSKWLAVGGLWVRRRLRWVLSDLSRPQPRKQQSLRDSAHAGMETSERKGSLEKRERNQACEATQVTDISTRYRVSQINEGNLLQKKNINLILVSDLSHLYKEHLAKAKVDGIIEKKRESPRDSANSSILKQFKEHLKINKTRKKQRLLNLMLIFACLTQDKEKSQERASLPSLNGAMQHKVSQQITSSIKQKLKEEKSLINFLSLLNHSKDPFSKKSQIDEIKKDFIIKLLCALPLCSPHIFRDFEKFSRDRSSLKATLAISFQKEYTLFVSLIMKIYKELPLDFYILCLLEQKLQKQIFKFSSKTTWQNIYTKTYYKSSLISLPVTGHLSSLFASPTAKGEEPQRCKRDALRASSPFAVGDAKRDSASDAFGFTLSAQRDAKRISRENQACKESSPKMSESTLPSASFGLSTTISTVAHSNRASEGEKTNASSFLNGHKRKDINKATSQIKTRPVNLCLNIFKNKNVALNEGGLSAGTSLRLQGPVTRLVAKSTHERQPCTAGFSLLSREEFASPFASPTAKGDAKGDTQRSGERAAPRLWRTRDPASESLATLLHKFTDPKNSRGLNIKKFYGIKLKQKHILLKIFLQKIEKYCTTFNIQAGQNFLKILKPFLFLHVSLILKKVKQPLLSTIFTTKIKLSFSEIETKIHSLMQQYYIVEDNIISNALSQYFLRPLIIINLFKNKLNQKNSLSLLTHIYNTKGLETPKLKGPSKKLLGSLLSLALRPPLVLFVQETATKKRLGALAHALLGISLFSPFKGRKERLAAPVQTASGFAYGVAKGTSKKKTPTLIGRSFEQATVALLGVACGEPETHERCRNSEAQRSSTCATRTESLGSLAGYAGSLFASPTAKGEEPSPFSRLRTSKMYNNVYSLSHRERWTTEKDWQIFILYNSAPQQYQDVPIFAYQHRFSSLVTFGLGGESPPSYSLGLLSNVGGVREEKRSEFAPIVSASLTHLHAQTQSTRFGPDRLPTNRLSNAFYVGPGIIQQLLFELNFSEIKKLDKQNRFFLYQLNKYRVKLKKQAEILLYDKNTKNALKELGKKRDLLIRRTKLIRKLYRKDSDPSSMVLTLLPVLPPDLRPIVKMGDQIAASDLNILYKRVIYRNERLKKFLKDPATSYSSEMKYAQRLLQEAVDNLIQNGKGGSTGGAAEKDSRGRILKSLSDLLKGKQGRFRQFLLGKRVDYSGRSVIVVGPKLKLNECGIPFEMAKVLYLPFLMKVILKKHYARTNEGAKKLIQNNPALTQELLNEIMQASPVLLNRAPTLHRLGIQAFVPKLVEGRAILLHPLVCSAFNADFDGDQMAVHVPITVEARAEAWKLMLSRNNLLSPATGDPLAIPSQDMVLGCYYLTTYSNKGSFHNLKGSGFYFNNFNEVVNAYNNSELLAFKTVLNLHSLIWVKWTNFIENGSDQTEPLEIRVSPLGNWQEISNHYHRFFDSQNVMINQYITTTPGRILFNMLLQKITSN